LVKRRLVLPAAHDNEPPRPGSAGGLTGARHHPAGPVCGYEPDAEDGQDEEGRQECADAGEPRMTSSTVDAVTRGMAAPHVGGLRRTRLAADCTGRDSRLSRCTLARSRREVGRGELS